MVYKQNFVAAIKVGGKVLREFGGEVELPFGSEYSILLKNLNSVKAQVQVSIDGESAGPWYVIEPNSDLELERFNRTGNQQRGNRFKFIERTDAVEEHRGIKAEDGLIRVEFKFEKRPPVIHHQYTYHHDHYYTDCWPRPWREPYVWLNDGLLRKDLGPTITCHGISAQAMNNTCFAGPTSGSSAVPTFRPLTPTSGSSAVPTFRPLTRSDMPKNDAGITVEGSESNQRFVTVSDFETEKSEVLTLKLIGRVADKPVQQPVTVDLRAKCKTCGKRASGQDKFCSRCGTALQII